MKVADNNLIIVKFYLAIFLYYEKIIKQNIYDFSLSLIIISKSNSLAIKSNNSKL